MDYINGGKIQALANISFAVETNSLIKSQIQDTTMKDSYRGVEK
jgi:hypothetical protein